MENEWKYLVFIRHLYVLKVSKILFERYQMQKFWLIKHVDCIKVPHNIQDGVVCDISWQ